MGVLNETPPYRLYQMPCMSGDQPDMFKNLGEVYDYIKDALNASDYVVESDYEGDEQVDCGTLIKCCTQIYIPKSIKECLRLTK